MNPLSSLKNLFDMSKEYVEMKVELERLKIINKSATISSELISVIILLLIVFLSVSLLSIAVAFLIGSWFRNYYIGFVIMGGFYLIIFFIVYMLRVKWIKKPFSKNIVNEMLN